MTARHDPRGGAEEVVTDAFTFRLPQWRAVQWLFGRNPLVRISDRVQASVLFVVVLVWLLAFPIVATVGVAVYDSRRVVYAEEVASRHPVTATVTESPSPPTDLSTRTVEAKWVIGGTTHTGQVETRSPAQIGETMEIWVDENGVQVDEPTSTTTAAAEAVTVAALMWIGVAAAATTVYVGTRIVCDRRRDTRWQHDLDNHVTAGGKPLSN
jgi:hypothetical protein